MERRDGWRERLSHYNTDFPHTHTLSLTIIMVLPTCPFRRKWVVVEHNYTHTKQGAFLDRPGHLCTKQVRCAGATQTPKARARSSKEVPTVPPIGSVGTRSPTTTISGQLRHIQPVCSTRPGTRFTDEWAGIIYNGIV